MADLCDAYPGRFPSEVLAEVGRLPAGFFDEVLEAGAYRQAKQMVEAADSAEARKRLPQTTLFQLVPVIDFAITEVETKKREGG